MYLVANISMLFTELPLPLRLGAAKAAGFAGVEIQFPADEDIAPLKEAMAATALPIVLINVPRGPEEIVGMAALPDQQERFRQAVTRCRKLATELDVRLVNVLAGCPSAGSDRTQCRKTLVENLRKTAESMAQIGVGVVLEPVNPVDVPGFFVDSLAAGMSVLDEAGNENLALQFDLYHMALTEPDLVGAIDRAQGRIGHVQFADSPGRHEPGTGEIDFAAALRALRRGGYDGAVSAEYKPAGRTAAGLSWTSNFKGMME